ncbi:MAG: phosphotransferase [Rudaea sp.]|nr:phosphotransferase [Rudaea sp.]
MNSPRHTELQRFVAAQFPHTRFSLAPASADASFRSYWRVDADDKTWVVMDAPPDKENIAPWLDIGARLHAAALHTPEVHAVDPAAGFILMEDLGTRTYLPELNTVTVDALYADAFDALLTMQTRVSAQGLSAFDDAFVTMDLELMAPWFLMRHLGYALTGEERGVIDAAIALLTRNVRAQPQSFMHRDFHSRNLMIVGNGEPGAADTALANPGIIDFQGALLGPITYDLASLLRDCYIAWPGERVDAWVERHRLRLIDAGAVDAGAEQFRRWFDLTGLQRHIKVLGLFCRLNYRDGKAAYLSDLPLVLDYVLGVSRRYPELEAFAALIERAVADRDITEPLPKEKATWPVER